MVDLSQQPVTSLLARWSAGDKEALEALAPLVFEDLRRLAHHYIRGERAEFTLQATALVHEAYLRLVDWQNADWKNRAHFFGVAAQMMRRILVDRARERRANKRGAGAVKVTLTQARDLSSGQSELDCVDLLALDAALKSLEKLDPQQVRVVETRFFGGLSVEETAEALSISTATVKREWRAARAWLFRELRASADESRQVE
jgi:RNA polymerase sigma factor (TIGR02999 family)